MNPMGTEGQYLEGWQEKGCGFDCNHGIFFLLWVAKAYKSYKSFLGIANIAINY